VPGLTFEVARVTGANGSTILLSVEYGVLWKMAIVPLFGVIVAAAYRLAGKFMLLTEQCFENLNNLSARRDP